MEAGQLIGFFSLTMDLSTSIFQGELLRTAQLLLTGVSDNAGSVKHF
jgi:hypothetical protein